MATERLGEKARSKAEKKARTGFNRDEGDKEDKGNPRIPFQLAATTCHGEAEGEDGSSKNEAGSFRVRL